MLSGTGTKRGCQGGLSRGDDERQRAAPVLGRKAALSPTIIRNDHCERPRLRLLTWLTQEQMDSFGWRIPYLIGGVANGVD